MGAIQKRTQKAERTRSQIIDAAASRFAELGYRGARLEDVGRDVGIGRSAVLYHFSDKRVLYRAVLDRLFGGLLDTIQSPLITGPTLPARIESAVCAFVDYMAANPMAARLALRESISPDPASRDELRAQLRPFLHLVEIVLAEGEREGVFRPNRPDALHLTSTVGGSTLVYMAALPTFVADLPYDPLDPDQVEAHKRDMIAVTRRLLGIGGPRSVSDRPD